MLNTVRAYQVNDLLALGYPLSNDQNYELDIHKLNSFIEEHADGIVMLDAMLDERNNVIDFTYMFINGTAEKLLKRSRREMIGKKLLDLFPGTVKEGIFDIYKKVYSTGRSVVLQFHYTHEGFDTTFRQKIEKFEKGILVHTADITNCS